MTTGYEHGQAGLPPANGEANGSQQMKKINTRTSFEASNKPGEVHDPRTSLDAQADKTYQRFVLTDPVAFR